MPRPINYTQAVCLWGVLFLFAVRSAWCCPPPPPRVIRDWLKSRSKLIPCINPCQIGIRSLSLTRHFSLALTHLLSSLVRNPFARRRAVLSRRRTSLSRPVYFLFHACESVRAPGQQPRRHYSDLPSPPDRNYSPNLGSHMHFVN
jgi:hypothetical protein